ncbi:MAG: hypothetical protein WC683_01565 [bacterium]
MERGGQRYIRNEHYDVAAVSYDVLADDRMATLLVSHTATAPVTINLKSAWIAKGGNTITVKDSGMNASLNNITVATEAGELIEGSALDLVINVDGASVTLQTDGSDVFII